MSDPSAELTRLRARVAELEAALRARGGVARDALPGEALANSFIDSARAVVLVLDAQGRIVHYNRYFEEISGRPLQETRGKDWFETFLPERDRPRTRALFGAAGEVRTRANENAITTADGGERRIEWADTPLHDAQGNFIGLLAIGHDITERKRVEQALQEVKETLEGRVRERAERLDEINRSLRAEIAERQRAGEALRRSEESLVQAQRIARMGNWDWDLVENNLRWSAEVYRLFGLSPEGFGATYEAFLDLVHPDDRDRVRAAVDAAVAGKSRYALDHRIVRRDGTERLVYEQAEVLRDAEGRPVRMIGTVQDVTDQRRAEAERAALLESERQARQEAERANRARDLFLALVSHELRTPLAAILLRAQYLLRTMDLPPKVREGVARIEKAALAQKRLVDDLLAVSSSLTGKLTIERRPLDPAGIAWEAVEGVKDPAAGKGLTLVAAIESGLPAVEGDALRLRQVLSNLLDNAVKFTPTGGRVEVMAERVVDPNGRPRVRFRVRDTGEGIAPQFLPSVFDLFSQADSSSTRRYGGLGLGLALCRSLVELHAGTIRAESEGLGRGAVFTVELPALDHPGEARQEGEHAAVEPSGLV